MKKRFWVLCLIFLMLMPTITAHADVILEPTNEFYLFNASSCAYLDQGFIANGAGGSVSVKKEPGSDMEAAVLDNNTELHVYCTYRHEGSDWGLVVEKEDILRSYGWVLMDELLPADSSNPLTGGLQTPQQRGLFSPALLALPVAAVAVGAAVLVRVFWKPKKGRR